MSQTGNDLIFASQHEPMQFITLTVAVVVVTKRAAPTS